MLRDELLDALERAAVREAVERWDPPQVDLRGLQARERRVALAPRLERELPLLGDRLARPDALRQRHACHLQDFPVLVEKLDPPFRIHEFFVAVVGELDGHVEALGRRVQDLEDA